MAAGRIRYLIAAVLGDMVAGLPASMGSRVPRKWRLRQCTGNNG